MMGLDWESEKETARGEMAGYTVYKRREVLGGRESTRGRRHRPVKQGEVEQRRKSGREESDKQVNDCGKKTRKQGEREHLAVHV